MILVLGGSSSGKSLFAEQLTAGNGAYSLTSGSPASLCYLATGRITDPEMQERVRRHRQRRGLRWRTIETAGNPGEVTSILSDVSMKEYHGILLDSVTTLVTNLLFARIDGAVDDPAFSFETIDFAKAETQICKEITDITVAAGTLPLVLVSDEIGLGVVPETVLGRNFRDILGKVNQLLAQSSTDVYFVAAGIPLKIKGEGVLKRL